MILDTEEQRQIILQLLASATIPMSAARKVIEVEEAVKSATLAEETNGA